MTTVLAVHALTHTLGADAFILDVETIDLDSSAGVAVVGPSGSGKSTLLGLLALALAPTRAERFLLYPRGAAAIDIAALWRRRRREALARLRARFVGFVPQTGGLLPFLSIGANIALPLAILGMKDDGRSTRLADALGIGHLRARRGKDVSVGERQRAALARALVTSPLLLLADEPTAALHPTQAAAALDLLVSSAAESGAGLMIATHDEALARAAGLKIARLEPDGAGRARSRFAWDEPLSDER